MIILYIFIGLIVFNFFRLVYKDLKNAHNIIKKEEKAQRIKMREEIRREDAIYERKKAMRCELRKQLDAVQYQLKLLNALDDCQSHDLSDEKSIKEALSYAKQYNDLLIQERNLQRQLNELDG